MNKQLYLLVTMLGVLLFGFAQAQTPTAEQMAIFKNLPPEQQQALAKEYGVSLPSGGASSETSSKLEDVKINEPRERVVNSQEGEGDKKKNESKKSALRRFGANLFANSPSTFAPTSDAPVPANYPIGTGDEIIVQLFGKENATHRLTVNRKGEIQFPALGPIQVAGMELNFTLDRKSTRLNSSHVAISYAVFCL